MMDFFGAGSYAKTSDFESFATTIKDEINGIKREISLKATDSEQVAKTAAINAVESEQRVKDLESQFRAALEELRQFGAAAKRELDSITVECENVRTSNGELKSSIEQTTELFNFALAAKSEIDSAKTEIHSNIEIINAALAKSETLPSSVEKVEIALSSSEEMFSKINDLLSHSASKKSEIDELRDKILGKEMEVDGSSVHVDGIKDRLEKSYTDIDSRIKNLEGEIQHFVDGIKSNFDGRLGKQTEDFERLVTNSTARIEAIDTELKDLLPGAMAAGLSAAYAKKKDDETESLGKSETKFQKAIFAMAAISGIPLAVDTYLLFGEKLGVLKIIQDTPNLLFAILPLYLPALWIAISLNKKINLSKRLIEEYTHKEVLGKTFSGISNQIETLKTDTSTKEDLRTRLLFNLLHVSAENPGKLITDYNKTDHPLLSVLDNSKKLSESMEALANIPGLSAITKGLVARAERKVDETAKEVAKGLDLNKVLEIGKENESAAERTE
jgi:DNA repair exonuclease SbcCD ATPase subunit